MRLLLQKNAFSSFIYVLLVFQCSLFNSDAAKNTYLSKIRTKGRWFIDENDRIMLFHGINIVTKNFPWFSDQGHSNLKNKTNLENLKKWGFNTIRLGYMWSGVYPEKDKLNQTYIDEMNNIIQNLESYGIYVILDMHQDMMSTKFNAYDGVPIWVLNEMPQPKHPYPWPFKNNTQLVFGAYITEACGFAFQNFYRNVSNSQTYFHQFWKKVAQTYSNYSSVLGYELINEPWAGDIYANPLIALPGFADAFNLMPLYDKVYSEIRKYDQETLVFYEPVTWGLMSNKSAVGTGFDHPPGSDLERTVFSWHFYCWLLDIDTHPIVNGTYPEFAHKFCDDWQLKTYFDVVEGEMKKFGDGASFMTEFGTCDFPSGNDDPKNQDECRYILEASDNHFQSWTYWDWDFYTADYQINYYKLNLFSRVYPMATNGLPKNIFYNLTTKYFVYTYKANISSLKQASLPSEIFVPLQLYPNDFQVTVSPSLKWNFDPETSKIFVYLSQKVINQIFNKGVKDFDNLVTIKIESK